MSKLTEYLAHKYNNMSKESKSETGLTYNPAYLGGYRQCVVDAQGYKPTLNENQQIVLDYMKRDYKEFNNQSPIEVPISLFENFENGCLDEDVFLAFESLNEKQEAEVIRAFMDWFLEQEETE